jgi:hypothetical protein
MASTGAGAAVYATLLGNVLEYLASAGVGPENARQFFFDLAHC